MPAYVIVDVDLRDASALGDYMERVPALIRQFGGRYLARGGKAETLEGDWQPHRIVIVEFPSAEQAKRFHQSPEYKPYKDARLAAGTSDMIVVEGLEKPL